MYVKIEKRIKIFEKDKYIILYFKIKTKIANQGLVLLIYVCIIRTQFTKNLNINLNAMLPIY
jgi:hypothetical protein